MNSYKYLTLEDPSLEASHLLQIIRLTEKEMSIKTNDSTFI